MPKGGARIGAGRKPKADRVVVPMVGHRAPVRAEMPALDPGDREALLQPPEDVPGVVQAVWRRWAAHAIAERTLTPATAAGFRQCCQQWVYLETLVRKIDHLGVDTKEASPYLLSYLKLAQRLDGSLARFRLTALGKPAVRETPKPAANPWATLAGKA